MEQHTYSRVYDNSDLKAEALCKQLEEFTFYQRVNVLNRVAEVF